MRATISSKLAAPFSSPNASHVHRIGIASYFTKNPPPTIQPPCGAWSLKRNSVPRSSVTGRRPALGCQKFTSGSSGLAARKRNQSKSVIPTQ